MGVGEEGLFLTYLLLFMLPLDTTEMSALVIGDPSVGGRIRILMIAPSITLKGGTTTYPMLCLLRKCNNRTGA